MLLLRHWSAAVRHQGPERPRCFQGEEPRLAAQHWDWRYWLPGHYSGCPLATGRRRQTLAPKQPPTSAMQRVQTPPGRWRPDLSHLHWRPSWGRQPPLPVAGRRLHAAGRQWKLLVHRR